MYNGMKLAAHNLRHTTPICTSQFASNTPSTRAHRQRGADGELRRERRGQHHHRRHRLSRIAALCRDACYARHRHALSINGSLALCTHAQKQHLVSTLASGALCDNIKLIWLIIVGSLDASSLMIAWLIFVFELKRKLKHTPHGAC